MSQTISKTSKNRVGTPRSKGDEFLDILIKKKQNQLDKIVLDLATKNNPKLLSIIKVEKLFKKHIEFDSRTQLLRKLEKSMKADVLNTIIARFVSENKLIVNNDHSLTWIDTKENNKLNKAFENAIQLE